MPAEASLLATSPAAQVEAVQGALWEMLRLYSSRRAFAGWSAASGVLVSQPAFDLLGRVEERGPITLGELGRLAHMDPSAVGRQVRALEELGLVDRSPSMSDRRVVEVRLTPRGKEVRQRVALAGSRHLADELGSWSESDRRALARLLPKLVSDLRNRRYELSGVEDVSPQPARARRRKPTSMNCGSDEGASR
ncbi:MAG: MarR family transcriptional regulator [Actinomycetota bacterium]|nr:MarR family transcriptional regulator [Actinomycetota bacterium]